MDMLGSRAAIAIVALAGAAALLVPYAGLIVDVEPTAVGTVAPASMLATPVPPSAPTPEVLAVTTTTTPAPSPVPAPAPAPPPLPSPQPGPAPVLTVADGIPPDPQRAYEMVVPATWRAATPVEFQVIGGRTSYAVYPKTIQLAAPVVRQGGSFLAVVLTHEFGHVLAYRYGARTYIGAPPVGFPGRTRNNAEHWADCVSHALSGVDDPSHGLPSCTGETLEWTRQWLAAGPPASPPPAPPPS